MEQELRKNFLVNVLYFLTIAVGVFIICRFLLKYLMPFLIGGAVAFIVQKPSRFLERKTKIKRKYIAAILSLMLFLLTAAGVAFLLVKAVGAAGGLIGEITGYAEKLTDYFGALRKHLNSIFEDMPNGLTEFTDSLYGSMLNKAVGALTGAVSRLAAYTVKGAPAFLVSCIVAAAASCYIAADFTGLVRFFKSLAGVRTYENVIKVKNIFVNSVLKLFKGYLILMLITFAELTAGLFILHIKYAPLMAALIAVIDILPVLGTGTVLIPWALSEIILGNTALGAGLAAIYAVITVVRNLAEPKIIGGQIGIHPLFTLLSMFIGVKLFGFAGLVILPVAFIVVIKYYKNEMKDESDRVKVQ